MKLTQYKCNLCGAMSDTMNALVVVSNEKTYAYEYILTTRDQGDRHICRKCIERLQKTFTPKESDE